MDWVWESNTTKNPPKNSSRAEPVHLKEHMKNKNSQTKQENETEKRTKETMRNFLKFQETNTSSKALRK